MKSVYLKNSNKHIVIKRKNKEEMERVHDNVSALIRKLKKKEVHG